MPVIHRSVQHRARQSYLPVCLRELRTAGQKKYAGEQTYLEIGDRNTIREFTTVHRGTVQDRSRTCIGNDNLLMAYTHVAHDCRIGNQVILANAASLGGHVHYR